MTFSLHGVAVSRGIAIGRVHVVERHELEIEEYRLQSAEIDGEVARLQQAIELARQDLHAVRGHIPAGTPADIAAFIDTHLLMLDDAAFGEEPARLIREHRCNAEWALKLQRDQLVAVFEQMDDPYLRTRRDDVENVVDRIVRNLLRHAPLRHEMPDQKLRGTIIVAPDLTPADLVLMRHQGVAGFVTEFGGPTSHVSILARSFGIPGVVGLHHARRYVSEDELLIVDGDDGVVLGAPDQRILEQYQARQAARRVYVDGLRALRGTPAVTIDGIAVNLQANVEFETDFDLVREVGAGGVGLYRTEFLYLNRAGLPDEETHFQTYRRLMDVLGGIPVTIRTADLGADKPFGQAAGTPVPNPALGLRAIRLCLREPALFGPQLRAILRVSAFGPVRMMIPMLSAIDEVHQVLEVVEGIRAEFRRRGVAFDPAMPIGGMIEVPAAAVCADVFARSLDFLSIGTNDLIQYAIAIDRVNDEVSYLYDPLNIGVLRLIQNTIDAGHVAARPVAMCGEMAGDPRYTRLLLGLGLREFSVHPSALLEIKHIINRTAVSAVAPLARQLLHAADATRRRELLAALDGSMH